MTFAIGRRLTLGLACLALVSCSQKDEPKPTDPVNERPVSRTDAASEPMLTPYLAVLAETPTDADGEAVDLSGLVAALPDYVSLTWDAQRFDETSGATVFDGLQLALSGDTPIGMRLDQARIWGLETDLLEARLGGQRLSETGPLFDRLDGTGLSYVGMAEGFNAGLDWMLDLMVDGTPPEVDVEVEEFSFEAQRFVLTGAYLRPWEYSALTSDHISAWTGEEVTDLPDDLVYDFIHFGQQFVAGMRSLGYANAVVEQGTGKLSMRLPDETTQAEFHIGLQGTSGVAGLDVDRNVSFDIRTLETTDMAEIGPYTQEEAYRLSSVDGLKLDRLAGFIARSELPDMDQRDLISFGDWAVQDYTLKLNDATVATLKSGQFDFSHFDWFIPTEIDMAVDGLTIDFEEITGFGLALIDALADDPSLLEGEVDGADELAQFQTGLAKALELLPEHGLDTITFSADTRLSWSSETGATAFALNTDANDFGNGAISLSLTLPDYSQIQAAVESDDMEAAMSEAFETQFAFNGLRLFERDGGGYDKIFGFAQAIGQEYPDEGWGAMLGAMEPADMRNYIATMIRIGKTEAEAEFPPAGIWLEEIASYFAEGGELEIKLAPPQPINKTLIESYDGEPEPAEIVEIFGISVTHRK